MDNVMVEIAIWIAIAGIGFAAGLAAIASTKRRLVRLRPTVAKQPQLTSYDRDRSPRREHVLVP